MNKDKIIYVDITLKDINFEEILMVRRKVELFSDNYYNTINFYASILEELKRNEVFNFALIID